MLNTRYIIANNEARSLADTFGCEPLGAAWFVEGVSVQQTPKSELEALEYVDLGKTAVVNEQAAKFDSKYDASGRIELTEYAPNYLKYEYEAPAKALVVFSEIYFPDGWTAYVDGEPMPYFAADYILRAMELPAGKHVVEWKFRAPGWAVSTTITAICSWIILLGVLLVVALPLIRKYKKCGNECK
jgi:hypothetical protein